jgi:uncharacterized MAPEG superfamily protein
MEAADAWKAFSTCLVLLFAKGLATSLYQARLRVRTRAFLSPEDARLMRAGSTNLESPQLQRAGAVWRNDLENIPYFILLALTYVLAGCWPAGAAPYFGLFVLFRFGHTAAYLQAVQPLRFFCYSGGVVISCILSLHIIYQALIS